MTLADEINQMIVKALKSIQITSAGGDSPKINTVTEVTELDKPDLEAFIKEGTDDDTAKENKKIDSTIKKVDKFDKGNVGDVSRFTSQQMGNLREFVNNPVQFMVQTVFRKFAKGLGVLAFAAIIFEAVKFIISELLKPGRLLDLRFKRDIKDEIIAFRRREEQQKLKQGFSNIIITSTPRLRGGQNQTVNTFDLVRTGNFPENIGASKIMLEAAGEPLSKSHGRRNFGGPGR